jgi:Xaa-Pro dipeptidase
MVLCIEPAIGLAAGRMLVDEECIVIRDGAPEIFSVRAPRELPVLA